jgi:2-dehydropantoate 2-reductase
LVIDELLKEGVGIANTLNINISLDEVRNMLFDTIKKSSTNRSSMLRDIEMGRRTEIEEINGYIIKKGNFVKLKVIYNSLLYSLIRSMEELANKKRD